MTVVPVGIDPGLGETGAVILDENLNVLASATWTAPKGATDLQRCVSLAGTVAAWVFQNLPGGNAPVKIGLETPVFTHSAGNFAKQWRLLSLLEAHLWTEARKLKREVVLVEVGPTESKRALTGHGNADKDDMVNYGPFTDAPDMKRETKEALSDAYAHGIAPLKEYGQVLVRLDTLVPIRVKPLYERKEADANLAD